jgi:Amt family ammonium transporter
VKEVPPEEREMFKLWVHAQQDEEVRGHNQAFVALGTTILWVSWLFFNGGSAYSLATPRQNSAPKIIMNTLLAPATAGLVTVFLKPLVLRTYTHASRYDVGNICNGILVGCVAVTGICDRCENWAAVIIGVIGAFFYMAGCKFLETTGIDDPVEATAVHGFGGLWGLVAVAVFDNTTGIIYEREHRGYYLGM